LQEVTCSFTVAPTPVPSLPPTPTPAALGVPTGIRVLPGNGFLTVQWLAPTVGAEAITDYLLQCTPVNGGQPIQTQVAASAVLEAKLDGLTAGSTYSCQVAATDGVTIGPYSTPSDRAIVLGIPTAPGQPAAEPLNGAARLSVVPIVGGPPIEQYVYVCTNTSGQSVQAAGSEATVVVPGLTNGQTFQCVAYAENSVGRSPASVASASFSPCAGLFDCQPWTKFALGGIVIAAIAVVGLLAFQRYQRRNRAWITAQVDGGENRPLGWGPELGIRLDQGADGWSVTALPPAEAPVRVRFEKDNRFLVAVGTRITHVHQGDPTSIRDAAGTIHQVILRRYRDKPNDRAPVRAPKDSSALTSVTERLPDGVDDPAPPPHQSPPQPGDGA
ncbi:MAG TPA: fibronectin type III domain-containing protein, partial [Candidatus Dormibacteraeota bacterium]|nr:fibronectin type III domain-containing protein [Candidatus Dormibacteraeota bacterium]